MRSVILSILFVTACAHSSGPRPVNVAAVRSQINGTIAAESGDRTIHSMGKVGGDRAVVYTTASDGSKQEETWVKSGDSWKLETKTALK